jgi:hypothetical protein
VRSVLSTMRRDQWAGKPQPGDSWTVPRAPQIQLQRFACLWTIRLHDKCLSPDETADQTHSLCVDDDSGR